jgi:RNA polymerase sigma-70 factor (ECF subfamily)
LNETEQRRKFDSLVLPHLAAALSLARWLTGNATDAEDVVQDASIRAYRAVETLRGEQPRAWLLSIVRNTAFSWLAKNRPKTLLVTNDEKVFEQAEAHMFAIPRDLSVETALITRSDAETLQREIAALPLAYREVLILREIEEMNYREISLLLSIPVGTVMSRLSRARSLLIDKITKPEHQEKKRK